MLTEQQDLNANLLPTLKAQGFEIPPDGCYIAACEFDEDGTLVAYQMLQNAIFFEGLWARDKSAHLLRLYHMANQYASEKLNTERVMTMTRADEQGNRIGRIAQSLGFERMNWNIFRRKTCQ